MNSESFIQMVKDNLAAFLAGWIFGSGLAPVIVEQITSL